MKLYKHSFDFKNCLLIWSHEIGQILSSEDATVSYYQKQSNELLKEFSTESVVDAIKQKKFFVREAGNNGRKFFAIDFKHLTESFTLKGEFSESELSFIQKLIKNNFVIVKRET